MVVAFLARPAPRGSTAYPGARPRTATGRPTKLCCARSGTAVISSRTFSVMPRPRSQGAGDRAARSIIAMSVEGGCRPEQGARSAPGGAKTHTRGTGRARASAVSVDVPKRLLRAQRLAARVSPSRVARAGSQLQRLGGSRPVSLVRRHPARHPGWPPRSLTRHPLCRRLRVREMPAGTRPAHSTSDAAAPRRAKPRHVTRLAVSLHAPRAASCARRNGHGSHSRDASPPVHCSAGHALRPVGATDHDSTAHRRAAPDSDARTPRSPADAGPGAPDWPTSAWPTSAWPRSAHARAPPEPAGAPLRRPLGDALSPAQLARLRCPLAALRARFSAIRRVTASICLADARSIHLARGRTAVVSPPSCSREPADGRGCDSEDADPDDAQRDDAEPGMARPMPRDTPPPLGAPIGHAAAAQRVTRCCAAPLLRRRHCPRDPAASSWCCRTRSRERCRGETRPARAASAARAAADADSRARAARPARR